MRSTLVNAAFVPAYGLALWLYDKQYSIWPQAAFLAGKEWEAIVAHPHALRYLLVSPALIVSEVLGVTANDAFTWYVFFMVVLTARILGRTTVLMAGQGASGTGGWPWLYLLVYGVISFFMNGRLAFAFLGLSVIMFAQVRYLVDPVSRATSTSILFIVGLLFACVSSGTLAVATGAIVLFIFAITASRFPQLRVRDVRLGAIMFMFLIFPVGPYLAFFVRKNLGFYDGSLKNMFSHGYGEVLYLFGGDPGTTVALTLTAGCMLLLALPSVLELLSRRSALIGPLCVSAAAISIGAVGWSAGASAFVGLLPLVFLGARQIAKAVSPGSPRPLTDMVGRS